MKYQRIRKIISFISSLSLVFQSFAPLAIAMPVYAEDATNSAIVEVTPTPEVTPEATPTVEITPEITPDPTPTAEVTPDITPTPTVEITPTPEITPEVTPEATPTIDPTPTETQNNSPPAEQTSTDSTPSVPTLEVALPEVLSVVAQLEQTITPEITPSLSTDKADYFPTDTVYITGINFLPKTTYTLHISSQDNPIFNFNPEVTSDENGNITFSFVLDGNYRPNYSIDALDSSGKIVSSYQFTDSVGITVATSGINILANKAQNGSSPAFTTLGNIVITEGADTDFAASQTNKTLILTAPSNWTFNSSVGTVSHQSGKDIDSSSISVTSSTITITFSTDSSANKSDTMTISGVQVQAIDGTIVPSAGNILRTSGNPGNGVIAGITNDSTNFGSLSQVVDTTPAGNLVWPTNWTSPNSCVTDPSGEPGVAPAEVNLTGSTGTPAVGFASDANYFYFRERVSGDPGVITNLNQYSWVVLFQTSTPQYQYLAALSGKGGNQVLLYDNTTNSPSTGGVDFNPLFNDPADNIVWQGASSSYGRITGSGPYFVDWAIPVAELTSRGINASTTKFFATSTNANNYNKDFLQCYEAFADLSVIKTDSPDPVINGGTLTYSLAIHNAGPDSASGVVVTDTLPSGYSVTSVTPSQGTCSDMIAPSISCELGTIVNNGNASITIVGTITTVAATVSNTASVNLDTMVSIDLNQTNNTDTEDTTINPSNGTIELKKVWSGTAGQTTLNIGSTAGDDDVDTQLTGVGGTTPLTTGSNSVPAANYYVSETGGLDGYSSMLSCTDNTIPVTPGTNNSVSVTAGHTVVCTFTNTKLSINVLKTAFPTSLSEPGGNSLFTVKVENPNSVSVSLTSLTDDMFGNLNGQGTCSVPQVINAGGYYECSFTKAISGNSGFTHTNTVTAVASGASDTDDATVSITNVYPDVTLVKTVDDNEKPEPGGDFLFTLTIHNTSVETVTITELTDTYLLSAQCLALINTTLAPDASTSCTYTVTKTEAGVYDNTAWVTVKDDENYTKMASDSERITVINVNPTIEVTKTAGVSSINEPGGDVTYTFSVKNTSLSESVTITSLTDDVFGTLLGDADCKVDTILAAGATCSFNQTETISGDSGTSHTNIFTAHAEDNEENDVNDTDDATVLFDDALPSVEIVKSVDDSEKSEPGGTFNFTLTITNNSIEDIAITNLTDDNILSSECLDLIGDILIPGQTVTCTYPVTHIEAGTYDNTATVTVEDNEENSTNDSSSIRVTVTNENPTVTLTKSVDLSTLPEPGGAFTYTLNIHNTSVEGVTITNLTDDYALSETCIDLIGTSLAADGTTSCTYSVTHTNAGIYDNTAEVTVEDNEENSATSSDDARVSVTDVEPLVDIVKSVDVDNKPYPGGTFNYTLSITNNSVEDVTIYDLSDTNTLSDECLDLIGDILTPGQTVTCTYAVTHTDAGIYDNTAEVTVYDNEENSATSNDEKSVTVDERPQTSLTISKSNDASSDETPGGSVIYTIFLNVTGSDVSNLEVKDLLPRGFTYRVGSYKVFRDGVDITSIISEPGYHSPGTWNIDEIKAGQEIKLMYIADISSDQQPGLYPDAAWAIGTSFEENIYALAQAEGYIDTNFSGTTVNVVKDLTNEETYNVEKKVEGQVLGATTLPATGASPFWMLIAMLGFVYGFRLIKSSNKK